MSFLGTFPPIVDNMGFSAAVVNGTTAKSCFGQIVFLFKTAVSSCETPGRLSIRKSRKLPSNEIRASPPSSLISARSSSVLFSTDQDLPSISSFCIRVPLYRHRALPLQSRRLIVRAQGFNQRLQLPVHHFGQLMNGQPDAMVGHAVLGEVVGADLLAAVAASDHGLALFGQGFLLLLHFDFVQPRTQHPHAFFAVLDLRFFI